MMDKPASGYVVFELQGAGKEGKDASQRGHCRDRSKLMSLPEWSLSARVGLF